MEIMKHHGTPAADRLAIPLLCFLTLIAAAFAARAARTQEGDDDAASNANDALMILEQAAILQGGEEILAELKNFRSAFNLEVFDPDKGRGNFYVERFFEYREESGIMWTKKRRDDPQAPCSVTVFNGEESWRIGEKGKVTIFTDRPSTYRTDIENIDKDVKLTAQMFRFFFVKTLLETVDDLSLKGERSVAGKPLYIIEGRTRAWLGGEDDTPVLLKISVDRDRHHIVEVKLTDLAVGGQVRTFRFDMYYRNEQGVLIPCQIKVFGEDQERHEMMVGLRVTSETITDEKGETVKVFRPAMAFNVRSSESFFEVPDPDKTYPPEDL